MVQYFNPLYYNLFTKTQLMNYFTYWYKEKKLTYSKEHTEEEMKAHLEHISQIALYKLKETNTTSGEL